MALTIYKASAGSGKTFILSATFIANIIKDAFDKSYRQQLAVTFTNKATAEMKERILQYLYALSHSMSESDGFFKEVRRQVPASITNDEIRQRAGKALRGIIHDYDHFHVTTIDSFFQSLLGNLAHELGLSSSFKVELGDSDVLGKAVDRLMNDLGRNGDRLEWVTAWVKEQMEDDKSWNPSQTLKEHAKQILREQYMLNHHLLDEMKDEGKSVMTNDFLKHYKSTLYALKNKVRKEIAEKAQATKDAIENEMGANGINDENIAYYNDLQNLLQKAINPDSPLGKARPSKRWRTYAAKEKEVIKDAKKHPELSAAGESICDIIDDYIKAFDDALDTYNSCTLSLANLNPLRLLEAIAAEVDDINRENDRIMLAYTPLLFHGLSQDTDPSFVFEKAGTSFRHIMIDEFQDTSNLQWENMKHLLVENAAQGNSCMLVGDVKQGIYRFRGGDWNMLAGFNNETHNVQLNSSIKIKTLDTNFRSGEEIVNFNNRVFTTAPGIVTDKIAEKCDFLPTDSESPTLDMKRIYPPLSPTEPDTHEVTQLTSKPGGYVRLVLKDHELTKTRKLNEDIKKQNAKREKTGEEPLELNELPEYNCEQDVTKQMVRLHEEGVPYREMAILIRNKKDADPLMRYVEEHHGDDSEHPIALMSEEAFLLESSPAVMTIVSAMRYINDTTDQVAREYVRLHTPEGKEEELNALLSHLVKNKYGTLPFYEVSCTLAEVLQLYDMKGQSPYLYSFLDRLLEFVDERSPMVSEFLEHWDETLHSKSIPSAAVDGIRILTIHKSKGLAFHTVFIPYCDWSLGNSDSIWTTPQESPYDQIPLLNIDMTETAKYSIYRDLYRQEVFDKYVENLNLMYVAFTRAQQNLLIWGNNSSVGEFLFKALKITDEVTEWGTPSTLFLSDSTNNDTQASDRKKKPDNPLHYGVTPIFVNFTHYTPKLEFMQSRASQKFVMDEDRADTTAEQQENYRKTGIVLHELMSRIRNIKEIDTQISILAQEGLLPPTLSQEAVSRLITKRINHPTARTWFDGSWHLYNECSIVLRENGKTITKRPDRVMIRGNRSLGTDETIVIDFKFGKYKTEHREQVEEYMRILRQQGRNSVKGYLWYLYSGSIEEVL